MGAIISVETGHEVVIITDAAKYDMNGAIRALGSMVHRAKQVPLAVTFRGPTYGADIAKAICTMADQIGVAGAFNFLQGLIDANLETLKHDLFTGRNCMTFVIAAFVPETGKAIHACFRTDDKGSLMCEMPKDFSLTCRGRKPYEVWRPEWFIAIGSRHSDDDGFQTILALKHEEPEELSWVDWLRANGAGFLEVMRRTPRSIPAAHNSVPAFTVGGWADMTIVDKDGARTEKIFTWPDEIGLAIEAYPQADAA